ncbi:hypothetical protein CYQ88_08275 [Hydrogenovibrio sp. SC-1]|uniref:hypothetical protein n=1 Tax=Hydrogenovibrio sp. SC-1 TaxID=2065820 RepID=UPI000C7D5C33|nr:hypothetical protein [Hydrogenovibrio sp. SC-1]PLA73950.1 hypothetical protein CYQ88_08275 [Hydrogenovibrio sp. SC-1]
MSENLLNEVEYPLNGDSENPEISEIVKNDKQKKASRPKRSLLKLFFLILSLLLLAAVVLAGLYIFQSGQNPFNSVFNQISFESKTSKLDEPEASKPDGISPVEVQRLALFEPEQPIQTMRIRNDTHIKNDIGETPNLLNGLEPVSDTKLTSTQSESIIATQEVEPSHDPSITPVNLAKFHDDLIAEIDLKDKEILFQINALENAIKSIERSIEGLNQKLSRNSKRTSDNDRELASIKKFVSDVNSKVKKVSYLVKKQEKKILSKKVKQASPPVLSSFAIWNGKNAVYVEYPKGKLTMLYEGDIVNSWLVQSINSVKKEAVFKRGNKTEVLSIGGKK